MRRRVPAGSSPRMRGKLSVKSSRSLCLGLIPAHAGKTAGKRFTLRRLRAHPRACGENSVHSQPLVSAGGSSPRMRGKLLLHGLVAAEHRLIPAHAGKTDGADGARAGHGAHPRACGENAERSGVLALRSVRSWKTFSFPSSLKVTHCRAFVQLPFSRIRL